MTVDSFIKHF